MKPPHGRPMVTEKKQGDWQWIKWIKGGAGHVRLAASESALAPTKWFQDLMVITGQCQSVNFICSALVAWTVLALKSGMQGLLSACRYASLAG